MGGYGVPMGFYGVLIGSCRGGGGPMGSCGGAGGGSYGGDMGFL